MHYVICDVHGHYDTLIKLVSKLPKDAKLVFVGDLIDRGPKSSEVVRFVREGNHRCVMGNHEGFMVEDLPCALNAYEKNKKINLYTPWLMSGGVATLSSYGLVQINDGVLTKMSYSKNTARLIRDDMEWMAKLPIYLKLDIDHPSGKPVVISHSCIGEVWQFHNDDKKQQTFREYALGNRKTPPKKMPIFNVFGHMPVEYGIEIKEHYVNVDTGCYSDEPEYGDLSAYCVETGEVMSVFRGVEDKMIIYME